MHSRTTSLLGLAAGFVLVSLVGCGEGTTTATPASDPVAVAPSTGTASTDAPATEATATKRTAEPRKWEHETSDIPVDERIQFGHFDNGLRWAWASNPEPKERCYLRLHVNAGSLAETDAELGMAHFLEHMAFNGSANFPPGTLIAWFQQNGMAFGADTNAHTAFGETVYKLDLPKNDVESIRDGLKVLRDFATGMTIAEREVEGEKGVIDGEQRERDSAGMRVLMKQLELMFGDTRIGDRLPIGTKPIRDTFTAASVRAFYKRWYRPEHMTLVAVGDFGELDPVSLFSEFFATIDVPETPLEQEPSPGTAKTFAHFYAVHEPEIPALSLSISRLKAWEKEPVTVAQWIAEMPANYARSMLNTRCRELAKDESAPFMNVRATQASIFDVYDAEGIDIRCTPEKWKEALAAGEQELRRALEHGFQQAELDEIRANALRGLDEAVERQASADSRRLLGRILNAAENATVPTSAETRRTVLKPAIEALTVEGCHAALKAGWSEGELSITATGNLDLGEDASAQLRAAYEASTKVAVEGTEEVDADVFAYSSDPAKAGKIASRAHVEDLDFHTITFENGVALNLKRTDFRENQVVVNIAVGEGQLTLDPKDVLTLQMIAPSVMNGGGLAAHSNDDLRRLTAGKRVGVQFSIGADRSSMSGGTTAEDLLLELELAAAGLTAPGWREDGLIQMRRQIPMMFQQMEHQHQGPMLQKFVPALFSGDPRYGMPAQEALDATGVDQVKAWLEPLMANAPIEIAICGDIDVEQTIQYVAQTFGALPKRREWQSFDANRVSPAPKTGLKQTHAIATAIPKSLVIIAFPTTDGIDMTMRRKQQMLNQVVMDRLRLEVREKLGAAYSPGSGVQTSTVNPGVGMLMMQAMADPEKVDTLVEACLGVAKSLSEEGITDEELDRLREPILNRRRDSKRTNGYWMQVLGRAQSEAGHLDNIRSGDAFYEGVKPADLAPLAKQYLKPERASILIVNPGPKE